jgi:hypothetical protein
MNLDNSPMVTRENGEEWKMRNESLTGKEFQFEMVKKFWGWISGAGCIAT